MAEQISDDRSNLYESQWWARLAAISERRESMSAVDTPPVEKKQSGLSKALASLFPADQGRGLVSIFVRTT